MKYLKLLKNQCLFGFYTKQTFTCLIKRENEFQSAERGSVDIALNQTPNAKANTPLVTETIVSLKSGKSINKNLGNCYQHNMVVIQIEPL